MRLLGTGSPRATRFEAAVGTVGLRRLLGPSWLGRGLDDLLLVAVPAGALAAGMLAVVTFRRGERRLGAACALLLAGSICTTELLKALLATRAGVPDRLARGFPSGHTTLASATAVVLVALAPWRGRVTPAAAAAGYAAFVAGGVVLDGWHLPTDALGALCVTAAWALGAFALLEPTRRRRLGRIDLLGAVALAGSALLLLLGPAGLPGAGLLTWQEVEAVAGVAAAAAVATLAVGWALCARPATR